MIINKFDFCFISDHNGAPTREMVNISSLRLRVFSLMCVAVIKVLPSYISVIVTVRTNRTQNHGSAVVYRTPRSVFSTWVKRRHRWKIFHYACTWFLTSTNSWAPRRSRLVVFAATSIWWRTAARISSTSAFVCIPSMSSASTKCYRALGLIGKSRVLIFRFFSKILTLS